MNWKESGEGHMRAFGGKKGEGVMQLCNNLRMKIKNEVFQESARTQFQRILIYFFPSIIYSFHSTIMINALYGATVPILKIKEEIVKNKFPMVPELINDQIGLILISRVLTKCSCFRPYITYPLT